MLSVKQPVTLHVSGPQCPVAKEHSRKPAGSDRQSSFPSQRGMQLAPPHMSDPHTVSGWSFWQSASAEHATTGPAPPQNTVPGGTQVATEPQSASVRQGGFPPQDIGSFGSGSHSRQHSRSMV